MLMRTKPVNSNTLRKNKICLILGFFCVFFSQFSPAQTDLIFKNGMEAGVELFSIVIENTSNNALSDIPITIGQPFKKGGVQATDYFKAIINHDENNAISTIQFNPKVTHADGSIRHGVLSFILPSLPANGSQTTSTANNKSCLQI